MLLQFRCALRTLGRTPVFTATAVALLAVTIGATTAVFSAVNTVLFRPLPCRDADRLVIAGERDRRTGLRAGTSLETWREWQRQLRSFDGLAAVETDLTCRVGRDVYLPCARVSANFFDVLGVPPAAGRTFAAAVGAPAAGVVMLGESYWREHLGGRSLANLVLTVGDRQYSVAGIVPRGFKLSYSTADIWLPIETTPGRSNRQDRSLRLVGRLGSGASLETARAEIDVAVRDLAARFPASHGEWGGWSQSMREFTVGERRPLAALLSAIVGLVLLVACFNVATLLLARAIVRQRDLGIRRALGASSWKVALPIVAEASILCTAGAAAGLLLAWSLQQAAIAGVPELRDVVIDGRVLAVAVMLAIGSALASSAAPAIVASRTDVLSALKGGGGSEPPRAGRFRAVCLGVQSAGAVALLVTAVGLAAGLLKLTNTDPGFTTDRVLAAELAVPTALLADPVARHAACTRIARRLSAHPGVQHIACASSLPFFGVAAVRAAAGSDGAPEHPAVGRTVSPGYFDVLEVPLVRGRDFDAGDVRGGVPVAIVSEHLARELWPHDPAVGRLLRVDGELVTVVGVAMDVRSIGLRRLPVPEVYRPILQHAPDGLSVGVRTAGEPMALVPALREAVNEVGPQAAIRYVNSMAALAAEQRALVGWLSLFASVFGTLAAVLAVVGLNGTIAFLAARRTREIGIRLALGASRAQVVRLVCAGGLRAAAAGGLAGAALGAGASRVLASLLLDASPPAPVVIGAALCGVAAIEWVAAWWPAHRAARRDPWSALREE